MLRIRDVYSGSRILIFTHTGSRIPDLESRIPDPKTATKDKGENLFCQPIFCSHKFHKTEYYFIFDMVKKKFGPFFQELLKFLPKKKLSPSPQKYGFGIWDLRSGIWKKPIPDPGSGKNLFRIPDPGVKKAPDPGSGSATLLSGGVLLPEVSHLAAPGLGLWPGRVPLQRQCLLQRPASRCHAGRVRGSRSVFIAVAGSGSVFRLGIRTQI